MIAVSVSTRRGDTSASWAIASRVVPQLPDDGQAAPAAHPVDARGTPPRVGAWRRRRRRRDRGELLPRPLVLALLGELDGERVPQVGQHLDVERRVLEHLRRQRPDRPVSGRVLLGQPEAEHLLQHRAERDPRVARAAARPAPCRTASAAGSRSRRGRAGPATPRAARPPRRRGPSSRLAEVGAADRVDEHRPGPRAAQLHQVGALAVAVAGGPLGVHRDRAGACREPGDRLGERLRRARHRRQPVARLPQVNDGPRFGPFGVLSGVSRAASVPCCGSCPGPALRPAAVDRAAAARCRGARSLGPVRRHRRRRWPGAVPRAAAPWSPVAGPAARPRRQQVAPGHHVHAKVDVLRRRPGRAQLEAGRRQLV